MLAKSLSGATAAGGYQIERSLRFNSADSAYLNRTPASASNRKTWTWSGWVKRGALGADQAIFARSNSAGSAHTGFIFQSNDTIIFFSDNNGPYGKLELVTTQVFRDPSAFYHLVFVLDTTQATSSNRAKIYINGTQVTALSTAAYPNQNDEYQINTTNPHGLGRYFEYSGNWYFNGYMADINFIDGQALTPSSFGETDADTGVWKPKKYTGTYGTNGFFLQFADNSGTTSTTLGKDTSGNGNNWTPNNFSVTAGAGNDSLVDTPTLYGTDTGVGGEVRGNYCTLSPVYALNVTYNTPANGNLEVALSNNSTSYGTFSFTTGKWYWEITVSAAVTSGYVGVMDSTFIKTDNSWGSQARTYIDSGSKYGGSSSSYGASWTNGDVIGVAVDMDAGTIVFYKNGSSQGTAFSDLAGKEWKPMVYATTTTYTLNFGQRPFAYTAPSGYKALCTTNLPTPTIGATATTRADDYFNTVLYTGNGSTQSITGVGFQPDFVWAKNRSNVYAHALVDAVRGATNQLQSNSTNAEFSGGVASFNSDGFSVNNNWNENNTSQTYVAWNWKANGAGSSNTQGTITSTVSANTTAGFSIVKFTGTGANATVGHGLGVAPSMILLKSSSNTYNWRVYHTGIGNTKSLFLNLTDATDTDITYWNNTSPTSTVFSLGTNPGNNASGGTYIAYCFAPVAGYSAFGSYTGNGSSDGPFIYTNFRPKFVMIKCSSASSTDWAIYDATRSTYNVVGNVLVPNLSDAEFTGITGPDIISNGFKLRDTNSSRNSNGATYVYACFAEVPTKFALAR